MVPTGDWNFFLKACKRPECLNTTCIAEIQDRISEKFVDVHSSLLNRGFQHIDPSTELERAKKILMAEELQAILQRTDSADKLYLQYAASKFVQDDIFTGVCVHLYMHSAACGSEVGFSQSSSQNQTEARFKLHFSPDITNLNQDQIVALYDSCLSIFQEYGIANAKLVAPYANVNSMRGKEFSIYLKYQWTLQVVNFLLRMETNLAQLGVPSSISSRDAASSPIKNSVCASFRNERARVFKISCDLKGEALQSAIPIEASSKNYHQGNVVVVYGESVLFVKNGELVLKEQRNLQMSQSEIQDLDIPVMDGEYISAHGAIELSKLLGSEAHNPFEYQDNRFNLGIADLRPKSESVKRPAWEMAGAEPDGTEERKVHLEAEAASVGGVRLSGSATTAEDPDVGAGALVSL